MMKMIRMGMILWISLFMMACGVQSSGEVERDSGTEKPAINSTEDRQTEEKNEIQMEEVGSYKSSRNVTVGDDGEFYFAEIHGDSSTVYIFDSKEQQLGMVIMEKGYELFNIEVKKGRVLLFAHNYVKALLYHYVIETNIVEEYDIPCYESYIVYQNSIYFSNEESMDEDNMIIKTSLQGEVEEKIRLPEDLQDFSMELIYQGRIYIQDLIGAHSIIDDGVIYSMNLDGSDWKKMNLGKKFRRKYACSSYFDAADGYVYMIITTDVMGDPCRLYRFAVDGNRLELVAQNKKISDYAIGKDAVFYVAEDDSTTIYSVDKKTGKEKEFLQVEYANKDEVFLMVSKDSLLTQKIGFAAAEEKESIMVVPQKK